MAAAVVYRGVLVLAGAEIAALTFAVGISGRVINDRGLQDRLSVWMEALPNAEEIVKLWILLISMFKIRIDIRA